ncbi:MAG: APC family permease [Eubacteriales bacterium]|nr:APC family permease [Eubacteriales bacterium]
MRDGTQKQKRSLTRLDVLGLVIGSIIGWGSFTLPGEQFLRQSGVINTSLGLLLGGFLMCFIQTAYHRMLTVHRDEGGEFTYTLNELGKGHGFIVGWSLTLAYLSMISLNANAYLRLLQIILGEKINWVYLYTVSGHEVYLSHVIVMSLVIVIFAAVNIKGLKTSFYLQNLVSTLLVLFVLILLFVIGIRSDMSVFRANYVDTATISFPQIATVVAIVPFLFVGFDVIPQVASELNFKANRATFLVIISLFVGVFIYAALNLIAAFSFGPEAAFNDPWAVASSVLNKTGYLGFGIMLVALWAAISGGINGFMIASSKVVSALSREGFLPERFAATNKQQNHHYAIVFVSAISLLAPWLGRALILYIVDLSSVLAAVAYGYVAYVALKRAKRWSKKIIYGLALLISLFFIVLLLSPGSPSQLDAFSYYFLVVWLGAGALVYWQSERKRSSCQNNTAPQVDKSNTWRK